tara:strand:- start:2232 stop:2366 length:135 start_codon:yes stop_codon:yes gene_type:complete
MLGVVFLLLPGAFGFAIWRSYHQGEGDAYNPGDGKRRWRDDERS